MKFTLLGRRRLFLVLASVTIVTTGDATSAQVPVSAEVLDDSPPTDPWMKAVGDLDGDGAPDIVVAGRSGPVVWYRAPLWDRHTIAGDVSPAGSSTDIDLFDVDGDGDLDAVLANGVWHENPGPAGSVTSTLWATHEYGSRNGHDVHAADLDGDGDLDLATRHQGGAGATLYLYRNDGSSGWLEIAIEPLPAGEGLALGDLDGDGDDDLAIPDRWYENDGSPTGAWRERLYDGVVSSEPDGVVAVVDLDGDGRSDVIVTPAESAGQTSRIQWFRAPPDPHDQDWTRSPLSSTVSSTHHSLQILDWDLDGDLDVATARMQQASDPVVEVLLNDGSIGSPWPVDVVDSASSHNMVAADLDGDGDTDLLGADWNSSGAPGGAPLRLWRNELPEPGALPSLLAGASLLAVLRRRARGRNGAQLRSARV